jgi:WD40 repeat protein
MCSSVRRRQLPASADGSVKLWDRATGEVRHTLKSRKGEPYLFSFSPDDKTLTLVCGDRTILTWDVVGGGEPTKANTGRVCLPSPDGKTTATLYEKDLTVKVLDASTGKEKQVLRELNYTTRCAGFSQDGRQLATGGGWRRVEGMEPGHGGRCCKTSRIPTPSRS